jgi:hypothetical protein
MYGWLDYHVGKGRYWVGAEAGPGKQDAAMFYFLNARDAAGFVDRFACGLIVGREPPRASLAR